MTSIGDNGGPAFDVDTDDIKMSWIKLDIADFKRGIADLDYETRGYYITILVEMYDSKGKLPNDLYLLGKRLGTTARVVKRVLDVLVGQGKVYVSGDWLRNKRCDEEREKLIAEYCRRHSAAVKREENRRKTADASQKVSAKFPESLPEVSPQQSRNSQKFDESFSQTIPISPTKTTKDKPELWSASEQNCAHNLEKKKKEEEKKERENRPPASVTEAAREAGGLDSMPAIGALNGATAMIVNDIARWINPYVPQYELAHNEVKQAVAAYGDRAVRDGYMDLKADHADGKVRALSVKTFYGFCRVAKERAAKRDSRHGGGKPKASRW